MLYMVQMTVKKPHDINSDLWADTMACERAYGQSLMRSGKFMHIWRVVGRFSNFSVFDVESNDELHKILSGFPLFSYMEMEIIALAEHPSALK